MFDKLNMEIMRREYTDCFNEKWKDFIKSFNMKYASSKQLVIGNRIRPYLVLWGFSLGKESMDSTYYDFCANLSISLEGIHKASVIVDDIVDGDTKRRGVNCLHIEYSEYESVFFAVCLLSQSVKQINECIKEHESLSLKNSAVTMLCDVIFDMCAGALMEMNINDNQRKNLNHIQEIIQLETVSLLKNCLLIGYLASGCQDTKKEECIKNIGQKCGYIFQVINDLEPFCNPDYIIKLKLRT